MKILFVVRHASYLRNFDRMVLELLARGHQLTILFERTAPLGEDEILEQFQHPNFTFEKIPALFKPKTERDKQLKKLRDAVKEIRYALDNLRYAESPFRYTTALRMRSKTYAKHKLRRLLDSLAGRHPGLIPLLKNLARTVEWCLPIARDAKAYVRRLRPDLLCVTPYVDLASVQVEYVKAARLYGIPTALLVTSWDNLTNKGWIKCKPDRVFVWNEAQKREAVSYHAIAPANVHICGAWPYDHWFEMREPMSRSELHARIGLPDDGKFLLYLGSSRFIAPNETEHFLRFATQLRASSDPRLAGLGILIRPHPQNAQQWESLDLASIGRVAVWPHGGQNPIDSTRRAMYYCSLKFASGVMGVNTTAMIEAAIMGQPVFCLTPREFRFSQVETVHFHHLLNEGGGLLWHARSPEKLLPMVRQALFEAPELGIQRSTDFVQAFIRPFGLDRPATGLLVDGIGETGALKRGRRPTGKPLRLIHAMVARRLVEPWLT